MPTDDFFRAKLDEMIELRHPGGVGLAHAVDGHRGRIGTGVCSPRPQELCGGSR